MNQNQPFEPLYMGGSEDIVYDTCDDDETCTTALAEKAFTVAMTGHTFFAGSTMYWYNSDGAGVYKSGMRYLHAVDTNEITLSCNFFVEEDIQDTSYIYPGILFDVDWELKQVELHCEAAGATASEMFSIDLDSNKGSYWDTNYYEKDMNGVKDIIWIPESGPITISKKDLLNFTWANVGSANWGLKVWYRRLA